MKNEKRVCQKCEVEKALHSFSKMKQKDGSIYYRIICKECVKNQNKLKTFTQLQKERMYKRQNEYVANNPDYKLYLKIKHRNHRQVQKIKKWINGDEKVALTHSDFRFKKYMEGLFTKEMNWNNYGKVWNISYIQKGLKLIREGRIEEINKLENLIPKLKHS